MSDSDRNYNTEDGFLVKVGDEDAWDGELLGLVKSAARQYTKRFGGDPLPVDDLPPEQWEAARAVLQEAMDNDEALPDGAFAEAVADVAGAADADRS